MMIRKNLVIALIILLFTIPLKANNKVVLQLDWLHQFQFAGYYIAKQKGYYLENGIDLTIKEFNKNTKLINDTLDNSAQYTVGKSSLIIDKLNNKKIVLLAAIYQNSPMVLLTLKNSKIDTIEELIDKKVMLTSDARVAANITSMIKSQGVNIDDIDFIPHSFKLKDLINGKTDAMGCYLSNEPFLLKKKNIEFNIFNPADYGFNFYGGILFTSQDELKKHPKRVKNFYDATLKGWKYAFENIEETAKLIYDNYNTQNKSLESLIYEGEVLKKLAYQNNQKLGHINKKRVDGIKRLYLLLGLAKNHKINYDEFIYNDNTFMFNKSEKNYIKDNPISVLTTLDKKPYSYETNKLQGIEIDLINLFRDKFNSKINIIEKPKNVDILKSIQTNSKFINFHYNENFNTEKIYTNVITKLKNGIVTSTNTRYIQDIELLENKTLLVLKDKTIYNKLKRTYPNLLFVYSNDYDNALKQVNKKKAFAVIGNLSILSHKLVDNNLDKLKISGTIPFESNLRFELDKRDERLRDILNKAIKRIEQNEIKRIKNKYKLVLYKEVKDYTWIYKYLLPLVILILISLFTNNRMRKEIKRRKVTENRLIDNANKDSLTKVSNRRKIEKVMSKLVKEAKENQGFEFSIIFLDIDDFKYINDTFGHSIGDDILVKFANIISLSIRKSDYIARWGGEEFIIILPNTNSENAYKLALNLKDLINNKDFGISKEITSSFGISQYCKGDTKTEIIKRADEAMYYIKRNGKNNIKCY